MNALRHPASGLLALALAAVLFMGLECEELPRENVEPNTFFRPGFEPPDTLVVDSWVFRWYGTDRDSDLRAYEYRMLVDQTCDSTEIMGSEVGWTRVPLDQDRLSWSFADPATNPDGPYVFQARTIDEFGAVDPTPLERCFRVEIQLPPVASFTQTPSSRQGLSSADFEYTAAKFDRSGNEVDPPPVFEYRYQFTQIDPPIPQPVLIPFTLNNWAAVRTATVTGLSPGSTYIFQVKARDKKYPAIESEIVAFQFQN